MTKQLSWFEVVAECQLSVQRIRAVLTTGGTLTSELQAELDTIILAMRNRLVKRARELTYLNEDIVEEALFEIIVQFHQDLRSPGFSSMERKFGAYISTTANRVIHELKRKYKQVGVLSSSTSLDATVGEDGLARHELIEDPKLERLAEDYQEAQLHRRLQVAIEQLPPRDREIITLRLRGVSGNEIAKTMGMSPANVTHIYNRVVERLRRMLQSERR